MRRPKGHESCKTLCANTCPIRHICFNNGLAWSLKNGNLRSLSQGPLHRLDAPIKTLRIQSCGRWWTNHKVTNTRPRRNIQIELLNEASVMHITSNRVSWCLKRDCQYRGHFGKPDARSRCSPHVIGSGQHWAGGLWLAVASAAVISLGSTNRSAGGNGLRRGRHP